MVVRVSLTIIHVVFANISRMDEQIQALIIEYAKTHNLNERYVQRYINFINCCIQHNISSLPIPSRQKHRHHIFPRSWCKAIGINPINKPINIIKLPKRHHVIAHKLLARTGDVHMINALEVIINTDNE